MSDFKTKLKAAKIAAGRAVSSNRQSRRQQEIERIEEMSEVELLRESVFTQKAIKDQLLHIDKDVVRIRRNIVFFFWIFVLSFVLTFGLILLGGMAALAGLAS